MARTGFEFLDRMQQAIFDCRVTTTKSSPLSLEDGIQRTLSCLKKIKQNDNKVMLVGNGGSAAIASHQTVDLCRNAHIRAMNFNDPSLLTCMANDFGYEEVFARSVANFCEKDDLLIAISSSGRSPNILNAVVEAKKKKGEVITFSGFDLDNSLGKMGDLNFYIPSQSYGLVETAHLVLIHSIVDKFAEMSREAIYERKTAQRSIPEHTPDPKG